jgi:hypothetical protein
VYQVLLLMLWKNEGVKKAFERANEAAIPKKCLHRSVSIGGPLSLMPCFFLMSCFSALYRSVVYFLDVRERNKQFEGTVPARSEQALTLGWTIIRKSKKILPVLRIL